MLTSMLDIVVSDEKNPCAVKSILDQVVIRLRRAALRTYPVLWKFLEAGTGCNTGRRIPELLVIDVRTILATILTHDGHHHDELSDG